jgi:hypothetical protein
MNQELKEILEKMQKSLKVIEQKNEVPYSIKSLDEIYEKLDNIIELLENNKNKQK